MCSACIAGVIEVEGNKTAVSYSNPLYEIDNYLTLSYLKFLVLGVHRVRHSGIFSPRSISITHIS